MHAPWEDDATVQSDNFYNPFEEEEATEFTPAFAMETVLEAPAEDECKETGVFDRTEADQTHTWSPPETPEQHPTFIWKPTDTEEPKETQVYPALAKDDPLQDLVEKLKSELAPEPPQARQAYVALAMPRLTTPAPHLPLPAVPVAAAPVQSEGPPITLITVAPSSNSQPKQALAKVPVAASPKQRALELCRRGWEKTACAFRALYERSRLLLARAPVTE